MKVAINQLGWRTDAEGSRSVLCFIGNLNGHVSQFKVREFDVLIKNQWPGNLWWSITKTLQCHCVPGERDYPSALKQPQEKTADGSRCWRSAKFINLTFIVYVLRYKLWGNNKNKMKYHLYVCFAILSSLRSVPYNLTCLPTTTRKTVRFYRFYTNQSEISR